MKKEETRIKEKGKQIKYNNFKKKLKFKIFLKDLKIKNILIWLVGW